MTIWYLSGGALRVAAKLGRELKRDAKRSGRRLCGVGMMMQPKNASSYTKRLAQFPKWAADNGAFTKSRKGFSEPMFRAMLTLEPLRTYIARCLFVVAPDKLTVAADGTVCGDARGTLAQFPAWSPVIRGAGFPVALVAQDGLEGMLDAVPWDLLDVLFIGGSDDWKVSESARICLAEARSRGKRTHVGRVNSFERLALVSSMLTDSADGTFLVFGPDNNLPRMRRWFAKMNRGVQALLPWRLP